MKWVQTSVVKNEAGDETSETQVTQVPGGMLIRVVERRKNLLDTSIVFVACSDSQAWNFIGKYDASAVPKSNWSGGGKKEPTAPVTEGKIIV